MTGVRCRRPWAMRGQKAGEVSRENVGSVVRRVTIRVAERVFRCEIHTGRNPDPSVLWLV
jgi:hypothetical protein